MSVSDADLSMLRHMLGLPAELPAHKAPKPYRDYAAVNPGDPQFIRLEALGMVEKYKAKAPDGLNHYDWFRTTEAGRIEAFRSMRRPVLTKAQRRYRKWLEIDCGDSFKDFLTMPYYAEACRDA